MWNDETRQRVLELAAYEDSLCRCGCGLPAHLGHSKRPFQVEKFVCYGQRALLMAKEQDRNAAKKNPKEYPEGWDYGLSYYIVPPDEDDDPDDGEERAHG